MISTVVIVFTVAACSPADSAPASSGPQSWIDAPLPNSTMPLAPLNVISHANDPEGVHSFELSVDGQVMDVSDVAKGGVPEPLAMMTQQWAPPGPGTYLLTVRASGPDGTYGQAATVYVHIGSPPTSTPAEPTSTPELTAMPTPSQSVPLGSPTFSTNPFYFEGAGCGPKQVTIQIMADPSNVYSVVLFYRLADADGPGRTEWTSVAMNPQGDGLFSRTLRSEVDVPGFAIYLESILQVQFVATDRLGNEVDRSDVYAEVQLLPCG